MIKIGIDQSNDMGMIADQGQSFDLFSKSWTNPSENFDRNRLSCAFLSGPIGCTESPLAKLLAQSVAGYLRLLFTDRAKFGEIESRLGDICRFLRVHEASFDAYPASPGTVKKG